MVRTKSWKGKTGCSIQTISLFFRELKLRNYTPEDEELRERQVPKAKPASVEEKVRDQLDAANPEPVIEEVVGAPACNAHL
ncbi:UNVERIFIED_CONTAM: hypothetical protein FKN15_055185 [Acipenser sinensis]